VIAVGARLAGVVLLGLALAVFTDTFLTANNLERAQAGEPHVPHRIRRDARDPGGRPRFVDRRERGLERVRRGGR
jgi:hypothetical protein